METISVFGLGKLGCTMLACFADRGWDVIGVDVIPSNVYKVNSGMSPIPEPLVDKMILKNKERISATTEGDTAVEQSNATFVIVPTPSTPDGSFSIEYVRSAARTIAQGLKKKDNYHLVVITSTVLPGDMDTIQGLLESESGEKCGEDFGLCYNPDFIAIGKIVHDFLNPDMVLIGQSDPEAGEILQGIHEKLTKNKPEFHRMSYRNAELSKITLNSFCTLKITFANVIAEICEGMPTGNAAHVLQAVGADSRVGKKYFKGGLAYGGPCFPRDNRAFAHAAKRAGVEASLAKVTDDINERMKHSRMNNLIKAVMKEKGAKSISVLGITYKEDTFLVEESAALSVVEDLASQGYVVKIHDPWGVPEARKVLHYGNIAFSSDIENCLSGTSVCFVGAPWSSYKELTKEYFIKNMDQDPVIIDSWDLYDFRGDDLSCIKLGRCRA